MGVRSALDDLRSFGLDAPLRAAYEASRRWGGHDLLFGRLVFTASAPPLTRAIDPPADPIPDVAAERAIEAARRITGGKVRLFGAELDLDRAARGGDGPRPWPTGPWWRIDIRDPAIAGGNGDVRWAWEFGRHRHLVTVARALWLTSDAATAGFLNDQLRRWMSEHPPEQGIHWYSNLEIALRAIAWLQVLGLARRHLDADVAAGMERVLYHAGRHLLADLPHSASSMRNNHLLGDALGLAALGRAFVPDRAAERWMALGLWIFDQQLRRQAPRRGSLTDDSVGYQRFVLEMAVVRALLDQPTEAVRRRLGDGGRFLLGLGAGDGPVPQFGDWDEGRVLVATGDPADFLGAARAALARAGSGASADWRAAHDEACWYASVGMPDPACTSESEGRGLDGGVTRASRGAFTAWLKAGSGRHHGHADLCSTVIAHDRGWVVGDPGTGAYNGPLGERNYFRSSSAHSALRLGGRDQLEPHRAFRWRYRAAGGIGAPVPVRDGVVMWGWHDAYRRLDPSRRVVRVVVVRPDGVVVSDWVEGSSGERYALSLPLPPGASYDATRGGGLLCLPSGTQLALHLPSAASAACGSTDPFDGWWSETYGQATPATRLDVGGVLGGPVVWSVAAEGVEAPTVSGGELRWGDVALAVEWQPDPVLRVKDGAQRHTAAVSRAVPVPSRGRFARTR